MSELASAQGITRRGALVLAGAAAAAAGALLVAPSGADVSAAPGQELVGSWSSGVETLGSRLVNYGADGSVIATQAEPRTPQIGCWVRIGDREFLVHSLSYHLDDQSNMIGSCDVRLDITVDGAGNSYSGQLIQREYDLKGRSIDTVNSTVLATRILPMPL